jgi:hypothetical protein
MAIAAAGARRSGQRGDNRGTVQAVEELASR